MTATSPSVTVKTSCVDVHKAGLQSAFSACSLLLWLRLLLLFKMRCRDLSMIITVQSSTGGFGYRSESYTSGFPVPFRGHVYKVPSDDLLSLLRLYSRTTRTSHESVMYFHKVESIFSWLEKIQEVGQWLLFWEAESEKVTRRQKTSIFLKPCFTQIVGKSISVWCDGQAV